MSCGETTGWDHCQQSRDNQGWGTSGTSVPGRPGALTGLGKEGSWLLQRAAPTGCPRKISRSRGSGLLRDGGDRALQMVLASESAWLLKDHSGLLACNFACNASEGAGVDGTQAPLPHLQGQRGRQHAAGREADGETQEQQDPPAQELHHEHLWGAKVEQGGSGAPPDRRPYPCLKLPSQEAPMAPSSPHPAQARGPMCSWHR